MEQQQPHLETQQFFVFWTLPSWILLLSPPAPASLSQIVSPLDDVVVGVLLQSFFSMQSLSES
jgi:hypothetical protein